MRSTSLDGWDVLCISVYPFNSRGLRDGWTDSLRKERRGEESIGRKGGTGEAGVTPGYGYAGRWETKDERVTAFERPATYIHMRISVTCLIPRKRKSIISLLRIFC